MPKKLLFIAFALTIAIHSAAASNSSDPDLFLRIHSHNDYQQPRPLLDALDNGFHSVEADLWFRHNDVLISHIGIFFKGTLEDLYLKPLQELVNKKGSVFGDGKPFVLWLDLKEESPAFTSAINEILSRYSMLSTFTDDRFVPHPVTVVLTGDVTAKRDLVETYPFRYAIRDSNDFSANDPQGDLRWGYYSLNWKDYVSWNGRGQMPEKSRKKLRDLVAAIHAKGRKVRFWDVPESQSAWQEGFDAQSDFVSTDSLKEMNAFIKPLEQTRN